MAEGDEVKILEHGPFTVYSECSTTEGESNVSGIPTLKHTDMWTPFREIDSSNFLHNGYYHLSCSYPVRVAYPFSTRYEALNWFRCILPVAERS